MEVVQTGLDRFIEEPERIGRIAAGLVTNQTGVGAGLKSGIDLIHRLPQVDLKTLFACEHGIRGEIPAGQPVGSQIDDRTGIHVFTLYGKNKQVTESMVSGLDTVIYDLQDAGVRFYTYLSTLKNVMEACQRFGKRLIVLDRPNPIASKIDGPVLDLRFRSFVGAAEVPVCIGLTPGEYARYLQGTHYPDVDLDVVAMKGWHRNRYYDQTGLPWIPPSPNLPHVDTVLAYPMTCYLEGTNVSEGRGTTKPFEWIGAPWLNIEKTLRHLEDKRLPGIGLLPAHFTPASSKFAGERCRGIHVVVTDREHVAFAEIGYELLHSVAGLHPEHFQWLPPFKQDMPPFIDLLWGTDRVRQAIDRGCRFDEFRSEWHADSLEWEKKIGKYKIYPARKE